MESQSRDLPVEIFCNILSFLGPIDIIRLQVISKAFRDITHDLSLWRKLYANANLPRPPGPFPFRSLRSLQKTLLRSAKLAESWTSQPIQPIASEDLDVGSLPMSAAPPIVDGRWLVSCESFRRIVLHDMDPQTHRTLDRTLVQVLWEAEDEIFKEWDACSIMLGGELMLYVIFRDSLSLNAPWKMFEFWLNRDTGHMNGCTFMDVPDVRISMLFAFVHLVPNQGSLLYLGGARLVFDAKTRIFYQFPAVDSGLPPGFPSTGPHSVLLTDVHVIALYRRHDNGNTVIQVFIIPTHPRPTETGAYFLQLTHQGETYHKFDIFRVIKRSSIHPIAGATTLRFLYLREDETRRTTLWFTCIDFTLPATHDDVILPLPISIDSQDLFSFDNVAPHGFDHDSVAHLTHSPDGHVRGLYMRSPATRLFGAPATTGFLIAKFTIDASSEDLGNVRGWVSPPRSMDLEGDVEDDGVSTGMLLFRSPRLMFDGVRGRIYYGDLTSRRPSAVVGIVDVR